MNAIYELNEDVAYRVIDGEAMVLNLNDGEYYSLNRAGTEILQSIENRKNLDCILDTLKKKYGKHDENMEKDLTTLIKELLMNKLIRKANRG